MLTLKNLRKQLDITQAELAIKSGLRQATISAIEAGKTTPHPETINALVAALDTDLDTIRAAISAVKPTISTELDSAWLFLKDLDHDLRKGLTQALIAEWTHSSTALEGNTISAGDTLFVLSEGLTISGKSLREHQELHGHAQAIQLMGSWLRAQHPIRIKQLHKLHHAIQTGAVIDSLAPIGEWKVEPNGTMAITTTGKTRWHEYATPQHTPALIKNWLDGLTPKSHKNNTKSQILDNYTDIHLGFVSTHPYADGNGRMARLLSNIPLLRAGFPPLVINVSERRKYITLLGDYSLLRGQPKPEEKLVSYGKERDALRDFFAQQWNTTLKLVEDFHKQQEKRS